MTPTPVFWNGDRWISERDPAHPPARPRSRRYREWILVGTLAFVLVGLAVPLGGVAAAGLSARTLIASWSAGYHVGVVQESSTRIAYRGSWTTAYQVNYLGGRAKATRTAGAKAQLRFQGSAIAWVGPIGPTRGRARVYVDGVLATTVNTYASSFHAARVLFQRSWRTVAIHRITIVDAGTAGHPTVALDAFVVRGSSLTTAPTASTQPGASAPPSAVAPSPTPSPTPTPTPAPKATPTPTPTPTPTTAPSPAGVYGTGYNMDSLANMQVGGSASGASNTYVSYRFRAESSASLSAFRAYWIGAAYPGYGGGTGGTVRVSLQTDSGGVPSGTVLAKVDIVHPPSDFPLVAFPTPPSLTAGTTYHLVFTNIDPQPTVNFVSVDLTYMFNALSPRQPKWPDSDYAALRKLGSGSWAVQAGYTPIVDLAFGNGAHQGQGYMEVELTHEALIAGPSNLVRERFTVSGGNRVVSAAAVRVARTSGSGNLVVRLQDANGTVIDSASLSTASVPTLAWGGGSSGVWLSGSFSAQRTLANGATYSLTLSTDSATSLWTRGIQQGDGYSFNRSTYFGDGDLEVSANGGSAWSTVAGLGTSGDLQFYLR